MDKNKLGKVIQIWMNWIFDHSPRTFRIWQFDIFTLTLSSMFISKSIHFYRSHKQINYKNSHIGLQKRTFRFESGNQWKKIEFPDCDLEKYVLSFESSGVKYHLLGIVPFHTHSNLLVKKVSLDWSYLSFLQLILILFFIYSL